MKLGDKVGRELNSTLYRRLHQFTSYHNLQRQLSQELWMYLDVRIWDRVIEIGQLASNAIEDSEILEEE